MSDTLTQSPEEMLRLKAEYLMPCVYHFYKRPPHIVRGDDVWLFDSTGKRYLDCYCGVTVMNAGHCNPQIIEPVIEQIRRLQHTTTIYLTEPILRLAQKLAEIAPDGLKRSFLCASGSEAVEGALLLATLHTRRPKVIAMENSLHGRTRWTMNATGLEMWRTDPFPLDGVLHVPFGDIDALRRLFAWESGQIAAIIAEPIQGNGGIVVPPPSYWREVRDLCTANGTLMIFDEVQTGFGRTGRRFASEHWNVVPDIMAISKALGNGFPIAAFITTDEIAASYTRPGASTHGGNPVSAVAALATLRVHEEALLAERAALLGEEAMYQLSALAKEYRMLRSVRGKGLMLGVEVVDAGDQPSPELLDHMLETLKDRGILCGKTGPARNVLTIMPPLTIRKEQLTELMSAIAQICREQENRP